MKKYYIGIYILITILLIYLFSTYLIKYTNIEKFEEISDYQIDSTFLKSLEGKDMTPKTRSLSLTLPVLPQLEGIYQGKGDLKNTFWKINKTGQLTSAYGLYGTLSLISPQKVKDGYIYLNLRDKSGDNYEVRYNGNLFITNIKSKPFVLELIDDPTILPLEISNIGTYIGNIKTDDNIQYNISTQGFLRILPTNRPIAQFSYISSGPPYQGTDGTYTFNIKYIDTNLQKKFGIDKKRVVLSRTKFNIYDTDDKVIMTYTKVLPETSSPTSSIFGFNELTPPVLEGCAKKSSGSFSLYDVICINRPYYIINLSTLLCLSIGTDGKTLVMRPIDKNNPKQIWTPRQYRINDRYNDYDNEWCKTDLEAHELARNIKYDELEDRAIWMRPESIYPRTPPRNNILQNKINYNVKDNNGDFLLENSTTRSFVKGEFNQKTTLLELSIIPAIIETKKRKGYNFNAPIYKNIESKCLYKCNETGSKRNNILEFDSYAIDQYKLNCRPNPCDVYIDPECKQKGRDCTETVTKPRIDNNYIAGCEGADADVKCLPGGIIRDGYITFGRWDETVCFGKDSDIIVKRPGYRGTIIEGEKPRSKVIDLSDECINNNSCKFNVNTKKFGDPWPNVYKHWDIHYNCKYDSTTITECGPEYCKNDPPAYCSKFKCADTRTQQFTGKYQPIECNDKYDNYDEMSRFRFEDNLLEIVTRVENRYNSLAIQNRQYVEANDEQVNIAYTNTTSEQIKQKRSWYFIPITEIDNILPKLKQRNRNIPLEKQIYENIQKLNS